MRLVVAHLTEAGITEAEPVMVEEEDGILRLAFDDGTVAEFDADELFAAYLESARRAA